LYRYGPSREGTSWRLTSPGAILATVLWIAVSLLFSWYAANLANYDKTYGSIGAVIALLMWFYITPCAVLVRPELKAELKQRTATTPGRRRRSLGNPADVPAA